MRPSAVEAEQAAAKRKKMIKWGLIGGAITIVVVLAIVLPIVLTRKSGDNPNPPGPGPGPHVDKPFPDVYNPYNVSDTEHYTEDKIVGVIHASEPYHPEKHSYAFSRLIDGLYKEEHLDTSLFVTYPDKIPEGPNNRFIDKLKYTFSVPTPSIGLLTITDALAPRYSVPESEVHKPHGDILQKLEMLGLSLFYEPFGF